MGVLIGRRVSGNLCPTVKNIIRRALDSEESFNLLLWGEPASSKTLFLLELAKQKGAVFFDCTNTTSRILDVLEQERPKIILFDELEKMGKTFQNQLLNFLESGHIKVDQMKRQYDLTIKGAKVFASANDLNKSSAPLRSRFRRLHLPKYTKEQFLELQYSVARILYATFAEPGSLAKSAPKLDYSPNPKKIIQNPAKHYFQGLHQTTLDSIVQEGLIDGGSVISRKQFLERFGKERVIARR
jgi:hypothetical protein